MDEEENENDSLKHNKKKCKECKWNSDLAWCDTCDCHHDWSGRHHDPDQKRCKCGCRCPEA